MDGRGGRRGGYNLLDQARSCKPGRWKKKGRTGACRTRTGESKEGEERKRAKERDGDLVSVSGKVVPVYSSEYDIAVSTEYRDREGIYNRVWYECTEYGICH